MPSIVAIAGDPLALQFALAGIEVLEVKEPAEAEAACDDILADPGDVAVLILDGHFEAHFSVPFQERLDRHRGLPLTLWCPPFDKDVADTEAYLASVIKPAVGYEIRLD